LIAFISLGQHFVAVAGWQCCNSSWHYAAASAPTDSQLIVAFSVKKFLHCCLCTTTDGQLIVNFLCLLLPL